MAQKTIESASVRRTGGPLAISRTDDGSRVYSSADPTSPDIQFKRRSHLAEQCSPLAETLARDNLALVTHVARTVTARLRPGVEFEELVSDGYIGLVSASRTFIPAKGVSFSTFARHRIRGCGNSI